MAYIGNGRTLLVLGSNVRDDIVPDNSTTTFNLSQEVPGGYEGNVYVFKQTYITERLITSCSNPASATIGIGTVTSTTWQITTSNTSIAAALSDIKEGIKLYSDSNHTLTISGADLSANNGTFSIIDCTYNGATLTITLNKPGAQGTNLNSTSGITISRGYSGFWEVLEPDTDYTIGGTGSYLNKQITFSKTPKVNDKVYVIHKGDATYNLVPSDNSVGPNQLSQNLRNFVTDKFTGNGITTAYTLSQSAVNAKALLVTVAGVVKEETTDYTLDSAGTTLTFTSAPANTSKIRILHLGFSTVSRRSVLSPGQVGTVAPNSITANELANDAVIETKILAASVTNTKIAPNVVTSDKILLSNNTSLRSYRADGTTIFSALTLNSSDKLVLNTPTTTQLSIAGTAAVNISSTEISPETTAVVSLGSSTKKFVDLNLSGQINSQTANVTGNITVGGTVDGVDVSALNSTVSSLQTLVNNLVPIGTMMIWSNDSVPNSNWLLCDGTAYNTYTYRFLHAAISNTHGGTAYLAGTTDQSGATTTFNIPDMRRRVPVGKGTNTAVGNTDTLSETSRALTHTHSVPAHTHGMSNHTHSVPAHFHGMGTGATLNITSSGSHTTTIDISHGHTASSAGSGTLTAGAVGTGISLSQTAHSHGGITAYSNPAHSHTISSSGAHDHTLRVEGGSGTSTRISLISNQGSSTNAALVVDTSGAHTHPVASTNIDHAHGVYADNANITLNDPTHSHSIASHAHTITVDSLGLTNKTDTGGSHTHSSSAFSGSIGLVTGGVDGNATMTSGVPSNNTTDASAALTSGTATNSPYTVVNYIIRAS